MRSVCWQRLCNDPFKKKSGQEPPGRIIQPDDPVDVKTTSVVIPGAEIMSPQQASAEIFHGEDHCHIEEAALQTADMQFRKKPLERRQQAGGTIDREHPQGSIAGEPQISAFQRM